MIKVIQDYTMTDVQNSVTYLLDKASMDEGVRSLAVEIVSGKGDPITAIYEWVRTNIKYTPDPIAIELLTSPARMVKEYREGKPLAGDCDDIALTVVALCRAVGIPAKFAILDQVGNGWDHAVAQVYSKELDRNILVDASTSKFPLGWEHGYRNIIVV